MNYKVSLDYDKINVSVKNLIFLENALYNRNLFLPFDDMTSFLQEINFEHDHCFNYKNYLERIYSDLIDIKRLISELRISLEETAMKYNDKEELTGDHLKSLLGFYQDTNFQRGLLTDLNSSISMNTDSNEIIDAVPIGVAIGVTGVAGSLGAVAVNSLFGSQPKEKKIKDDTVFEDYHMEDSSPTNYSFTPSKQDNTFIYSADSYEDKPYSASRREKSAGHYYGNEVNISERLHENDVEYLKDVVDGLKVDENDDDSENAEFYE